MKEPRVQVMQLDAALRDINAVLARRLKLAGLQSRYWLTDCGRVTHADVRFGEIERLRQEMAKWPREEVRETDEGTFTLIFPDWDIRFADEDPDD